MSRTDRYNWKRGAIDSHAHLTHVDEKGLEAGALVSEAATAGMRAIIDVGITPADLETRLTRYGGHPMIVFTCGLHPTSVSESDWKSQLVLLRRTLENERARIVAVGEAGLDYYWSTDSQQAQLDALREQAALARDHDLPLILHNRESEVDMLRFLKRDRPTGVMHCFSQDSEYCRACLDLGMYISFGGNLTYKSADAIRDAARLVPHDRLLVETDSPYLSPQNVRGTTNHPGHLGFTIDAVAELRGADPQEIAELTASNAARLFGLS